MAPVLVRLAGGGVRTARKVDVTGVVRNARRLAQDARLLKDHERYASAYVLAIISFEEIGKMLIKLWGLPASKSHISKQLAVTSLLIANDVVKEFGPLDQIEKQQIERVAKAVNESPAGRLTRIVELAFIDQTKQFALYHHDGVEESRFQAEITPEQIEAVLRTASSVTKIVDDNPQAVEAAASIFQVVEDMAAAERKKRQRKAR
jgi:AbiV family abortive infection protein